MIIDEQLILDYDLLDSQQSLTEQSWQSNVRPLVSVSCTTYNQKDYIRDCLDGFLRQKTTFPVEILIHDDASTDGTSDIVREYQDRYPFLMKVIVQKENQFSQGKTVNAFNLEVAKGEFIALCHGDDFWYDPDKLQKQVVAMLKFQVDLCGHPAHTIDVSNNKLGNIAGFQVPQVTHFPATRLIKNGGNMVPFGSIMISKLAKNKLIDFVPPVRFHTGIQLLGACDKGLVILPDIMGAYRVEVPGSTTEILLKSNRRIKETTLTRIKSLKFLKLMYGKKFSHAFNELLAKQMFSVSTVGLRIRISILRELLKDLHGLDKCKVVCWAIFIGMNKLIRLVIRRFLSPLR